MKRLLLVAVVLLAARAALAQDISARALLAFERYDYGPTSEVGFRQTYDLRLDRALTTTSLVRLLLRGDDFRGSDELATGPAQTSHSRQIQPVVELLLNTSNVRAQARVELFDTHSQFHGTESSRRLERSSGQLNWTPEGLPEVLLAGQRDATTDTASDFHLTESSALASLRYTWRGLVVRGGERYQRSVDPGAGYDRKATIHEGELSYAASPLDGKLNIGAQATAQLSNIDERSVGRGTSVLTPVSISHALYGIDDTPTDDRDHPLAPYPALVDGNVSTSSGISLGPDGVSFHNIAFDIGRPERVDEIRVVVRDPAGNPLRNGGGAVTWDVYTSTDGQLWTIVPAVQTTFNAPLSLYATAFNQVTTQWVKVVSFGVNAQATFITEVQVYYHSSIGAGSQRNGSQDFYGGTATLTYRPFERLSFSYAGDYALNGENFQGQPHGRSSGLEQIGGFELGLRKTLFLRGQVLDRHARSITGIDDTANGLTTYLDYVPNRQLRATLEIGHEDQTLDGSVFTIDTKAVHVSAFVVRSLFVGLNLGTQSQAFSLDGSSSARRFADFNSNVQLLPTLRLYVLGSFQENDVRSSDPAAQLLGPSRDNRLSSELTWRPGRPLTIAFRYGWVSGQELSGFTQRYHVDWYPFADGTVSLSSSFDEDIDPVSNRRSRRMVISPRWAMNRFVTLDVNYTSVTSTFSALSTQQRTLFATLTLTR